MKIQLYTTKKNVLSVFFIVLSSFLFAQNIEFTKEFFKEDKEGLKVAKDNIDKGNAFFDEGPIYYKQAIDPYLAANKFNPNNALLNHKIGQCYLSSNFKLKSIPFLEKAELLNPSIDPYLYFHLGKAYHLNMQWDKAIKSFSDFQKNMNSNENNKRIILGAIHARIRQISQ